jgi:hypothetical protein
MNLFKADYEENSTLPPPFRIIQVKFPDLSKPVEAEHKA